MERKLKSFFGLLMNQSQLLKVHGYQAQNGIDKNNNLTAETLRLRPNPKLNQL